MPGAGPRPSSYVARAAAGLLALPPLAVLALLTLAVLARLMLAAPARAEAVFEPRELRVEGRPILAFPVHLAAGGRGVDLGVVVVAGSPPDERREVVLFATRQGAAASPARTIALPPDVVALDVADVDPARGDELVLVSARALRIVPTAPDGATRTLVLEPPLPLPPRAHDLSLLGATSDWASSGEPSILLPTADGARLVGLRSGAASALSLPVQADYWSLDRTTNTPDSYFYAQLAWPVFSSGRDDVDSKHDLFALSRYGIAVFRAGAGGLPSQPSRFMKLRPFTAEEELRPRATTLQQLARDLDGDGLTDLVLHRSFGTLLRSEDRTEIHRNLGDGADVSETPSASIAPQAGIGILDAVDLDGDGRLEIVQARIRFGLVQLLRILTTRSAQVELHVDRVDGPGITGLSRAWSDTLSIGLDFDQGRPAGLFPTVDGDWNGDGRHDLLLGLSGREIGILLGIAGENGPAFAGSTIAQQVPATGRALIADLDGDGLDDLAVHDPRDAKGSVHWLRNRGVLPGTAPGLRAEPEKKP
jgi:hypothetical protein